MEEFKCWLQSHVPERNTQEDYWHAIRTFLGWLGDREATAETLTKYLLWCRGRGLKPATERAYYWGIRKYYEYLGVSCENGYKVPRLGKRLPKALTKEQVKNLFHVARERATTPIGRRNLAMLQVLYACGLRKSELQGLTVNDLYLEDRRLIVSGKGRKERTVPFDQETYRALVDWLKDRGDPPHTYLWLGRDGTPLGAIGIYFALREIGKAAGIQHWHPHLMRHTCATFLLNAGCNIRVVQEFLGHSSLMTTQVYTHVSADDMRREYARYHPPKI